MDHSSESPSPAPISENNIRYFQSKLKSEIENFRRDVSESSYMQTFNLCDIVKDRIINYEDEPQLSRAQNNFRRIYIASELIVRICSAHDYIVDFAFTKIINDLLRLDRYKIISSKIAHKTSLNLKKEKYFAREANIKLLDHLIGVENHNLEKEEPRIEPAPEEKAGTEKELEISHPSVKSAVNIQNEISLNEIRQILVEELVTDSQQFNVMGDLTEVRREPQTEASNLIVHTGTIPKDISLQPAEISIREPFDRKLFEEDIDQILQSNNVISQLNIRKSGLSENILQSAVNITDAERPQVEKLPSPTKNIENQIHSEESTDEWELSTLESFEIPKKKYFRLKTDKLTVIPNYRIRAVQLNKNIEIHRVQVFEGPPSILQSMSSEYLMKTSSFNRFSSKNVRSSTLNKLYKRNLTTEKRPVEPAITPQIQDRAVGWKTAEAGLELQERARLKQGLIEEVGEKVGMRPAAVESGVLAELVCEKTHFNTSVNEVVERDGLMGLPQSRIASPIIRLPDQEKISGGLPVPTPRIQQLQGTTLESKKHSPPWFFSTKEKPPRAEFREFNYVAKKLCNYWSSFERQGMEKSVTIQEFLLFEEDGNFANYLTVLRIVDKLSIQRKLFLDFKNGDVLIKPFEIPYISKDQLLLQGKQPVL